MNLLTTVLAGGGGETCRGERILTCGINKNMTQNSGVALSLEKKEAGP